MADSEVVRGLYDFLYVRDTRSGEASDRPRRKTAEQAPPLPPPAPKPQIKASGMTLEGARKRGRIYFAVLVLVLFILMPGGPALPLAIKHLPPELAQVIKDYFAVDSPAPQVAARAAAGDRKGVDKLDGILNPSERKDAVRIQQRLAELGYYTMTVDGGWGRGSRASLKSFKERNGLSATNEWTLDTQRKLFANEALKAVGPREAVKPVDRETRVTREVPAGDQVPVAREEQAARAEKEQITAVPDARRGDGVLHGIRVKVLHTARRAADARRIVKRLSDLGADAWLSGTSDTDNGPHVGHLYYGRKAQLSDMRQICDLIADIEPARPERFDRDLDDLDHVTLWVVSK